MDRKRNFLLKMLPRKSTGAEIGVWRGVFTEQLLEVVKPARIFLVDPWAVNLDDIHKRARYGSGGGITQSDMNEIYEQVMEKFSTNIRTGQVVIHRATSMALTDYPDHFLDWVYIDGDHTFDGVYNDLVTLLPKIKPGGYIAGDDYNKTGWWDDGVTRAVNHFVDTHQVKLILIRNNQFILQKN